MGKQMTVKEADAPFRVGGCWRAVEKNVRRPRIRIAKAVAERMFRKVSLSSGF